MKSTGITDIYQVFPDGWDFTPDVGNGQKRGEIFTPRFIVDKMISDSGMFPADAVYKNDYGTVSIQEASRIVSERVLEPASGTANFGSTILWHKLNYAVEISRNLSEFEENFLKACGSLYSYDIDPGNLSTVLLRFAGLSKKTLKYKKTNYWVQHISKALDDSLFTEEANVENWTKSFVESSLSEADKNWSKFITEDGVVQKVWKIAFEKFKNSESFENITEEIPARLFSRILEVLEKNTLLFNGIVEEDTVEENFVVPGWRNVVWVWWEVYRTPTGRLSMKVHLNPLRTQFAVSELEKVSKELEEHTEEHFVSAADDSVFGESLFSFSDENSSLKKWDSKDSEKLSKVFKKRISELEKEIEETKNPPLKFRPYSIVRS